MKRIYCFTSTGNSLYVARSIARNIGGEVFPINNNLEECDDDVIGFIFPVYFWGLPTIVENFIRNLKIKGNPYIFSVATYGGTAWGAGGRVNKLLKEKGLMLSYFEKIKSVENYVSPLLKIEDTDEIWEKTDFKIKKITSDIKIRRKRKRERYTFINHIVHSFYPALKKNSYKYFTVSQDCTSCGLCSRVCPVDNISIVDGKPKFNGDCVHCYGCLNLCPVNAIDWKNGTKGKKRYKSRFVTPNEIMNFRNKHEYKGLS